MPAYLAFDGERDELLYIPDAPDADAALEMAADTVPGGSDGDEFSLAELPTDCGGAKAVKIKKLW